MSIFTKTSDGRLTAVAWGVVADLRRHVSGLRVTRVPEGGLTAKELRHLERAMGYLDAAEEEICRALGTLSDRSKAEGYPNPDYRAARKLNHE